MDVRREADGAEGAVFDRAAFLESFDGDVALLRELAQLFVATCPTRLSSLRAALASGDRQALQQVAHLFKGSAGSFAAARAFTAAQQVEAIACDGDLAGIGAACARLEAEITRLNEALTAIG
jgi:HPt (histidine-containing phosphotransfer) domain-containing protein